MDWQQALRARALGNAPLDALIDGEVHWGELPQGLVPPNLLLATVGDSHDQHLKGFESIQPSRVQIDARHNTYAGAWAVARAALAALVPGHSGNGHNFSRAMVDLPPRDLPDRVSVKDGSSKTIFRVSMDLIFHHAVNEEAS